jgi:hypothetical protein
LQLALEFAMTDYARSILMLIATFMAAFALGGMWLEWLRGPQPNLISLPGAVFVLGLGLNTLRLRLRARP